MSPAAAERIYRLLLRAYPPDFRAEYGPEMVLLFRDQCQESDVRTVGFWAAVIWDVARSAPALRAEAWRENTRTIEVIMKLAAMLTVLLGVFGIVNAVVEWVAGSNGAIDGRYVLGVVLGVFASVLLLGAGVAILLWTRWSRQAARLALLASVVLFIAARLLFPWMSYFSQVVGFGMPVALLIALYWPRKPSTVTAASIALALVFGLSAPAAAQAKPADTTRAAATVKDLPLTAAERQSFVGIYSVKLPLGWGSVVRIFEENGVLKALSEGETRRLLYQGDGVFRFEGMPDLVLTFVLEGGRATRFTGRKPDGPVEGRRIT